MARVNDLTEKELRRLSRRDLLVVMLSQAGEIDELEEKIQTEQERHESEMEKIRQSHLEEIRYLEDLFQKKIELLNSRIEFEKERRSILEIRDKSSGKDNSKVPLFKSIFDAVFQNLCFEKRSLSQNNSQKKEPAYDRTGSAGKYTFSYSGSLNKRA